MREPQDLQNLLAGSPGRLAPCLMVGVKYLGQKGNVAGINPLKTKGANLAVDTDRKGKIAWQSTAVSLAMRLSRVGARGVRSFDMVPTLKNRGNLQVS